MTRNEWLMFYKWMCKMFFQFEKVAERGTAEEKAHRMLCWYRSLEPFEYKDCMAALQELVNGEAETPRFAWDNLVGSVRFHAARIAEPRHREAMAAQRVAESADRKEEKRNTGKLFSFGDDKQAVEVFEEACVVMQDGYDLSTYESVKQAASDAVRRVAPEWYDKPQRLLTYEGD
jgi:hypothetical protein